MTTDPTAVAIIALSIIGVGGFLLREWIRERQRAASGDDEQRGGHEPDDETGADEETE